MSSSDARRAAGLNRRGLLALVALTPVVLGTTACGFQPLYAGKGPNSVAAKLEQVDIAVIPDRHGQELRNLLIDRFYTDGRPGNSQFLLVASLTAMEQKLAIQKDATATRAQLVVNAPYRLVEASTGKALLSANARSYISYNVLEQQYAGLVTVENAYQRALLEISNEITLRVSAYLGRPADTLPGAAKP